MSETILAEESLPRRRCAVLDSEMSYVESDSGNGDLAIVALHGNPTSSYLWRNILPGLTGLGRCLAPDLIGMGESGQSGDGAYRFVDHARYLDAWFEAVVTAPKVVLIVHDWGGALGFHWARRHPDRVAGIAYMETIVTPLTWADWPDAASEVFQAMRSSAGEAMVLEKNVFVERILPGSILRKMSDAEMAVYRKPFTEPGESRRPTLTWPRQIPIEGEPADVTEIATASEAWLAASQVPKLFINAEPGAILTGRQRELCRAWPNQQEVTVKGSHFIQEDSPHEIAEAAASFISGLK